MFQNRLSRLLLLVSMPALLPGCLEERFEPRSDPASKNATPDSEAEESNAPRTPSDSPAAVWAEQLVEAGWRRDAADAVCRLNSRLFSIQADENPEQLNRELRHLARLTRAGDLANFIVERPETAALLATAADPELLSDHLAKSDREYHAVAGLFVVNHGRNEIVDLCQALNKNRDTILKMQTRGYVGAEHVFFFSRHRDGVHEYESWLRETLDRQLRKPSPQLDTLLIFLDANGLWIRERFSEPGGQGFARRFQDILWPKFEQIVVADGRGFGPWIPFPEVFRLLDERSDAEDLVSRVGPIAVDLLYGSDLPNRPAYPKDLRNKVANLLYAGTHNSTHALLKFRDEPDFHHLLRRDVPRDTHCAAFSQLLAEGGGYAATLRRWRGLASDAAVFRDLAPDDSGPVTWLPLYETVYNVPRMLADGRQPSAMQWGIAIADPVFLIVDVFSGGAGGQVAKQSGKKLLTQTLKTGGKLALQEGGERVAREAAEQIAKEVAEKSFAAMVRESIEGLPKRGGVDVTSYVKWGFRKSGAGRNAFRDFTGLEARVFMRKDARVFVDFGAAADTSLGRATTEFIEETSINATLAGVKSTFEGNPSDLSDFEGSPSERPSNHAADELRGEDSWQQNVAAWWLISPTTLNDSLTAPGQK